MPERGRVQGLRVRSWRLRDSDSLGSGLRVIGIQILGSGFRV